MSHEKEGKIIKSQVVPKLLNGSEHNEKNSIILPQLDSFFSLVLMLGLKTGEFF